MEQVRTERMATGGEAVARLADGRVVFVHGAVPDETVQVELDVSKKRWSRGRVVQVVEAGPSRAPLLCDHALSGECGGCDWLHVAPRDARSFKVTIVQEQLERLGGVSSPVVSHSDASAGRRTTTRAAVVEGRAGYRKRRSNEAFAADSCQALHPELERLMVEGRFHGADEVTLRYGLRAGGIESGDTGSGDRMVVVHRNGESPVEIEVPQGVTIVDADRAGDASFTTHAGGRDWRVSALSFFQTSDAGTEALVAAVRTALGDAETPVVDLYAGVGLLGGAVASDRLCSAVESSPHAAADARHNLPGVEVVESRVERWTPTSSYGAVIADPARAGLGTDGVAVVDATQATELVLVSCDPASLGRDTGLLREQGWRHAGSVVIDMFPDTSRIEVVTRFER